VDQHEAEAGVGGVRGDAACPAEGVVVGVRNDQRKGTTLVHAFIVPPARR
jgi:hypothetical protein